MADEVITGRDLSLFMHGYSCAIGPIRTTDPKELADAISAAMMVLHVGLEDCAMTWMIIVGEAMEFLVENAEQELNDDA